MLIDRTHRKWAVISTAIFVVATLTYISYASSSPKGPTGGSFMGLLYGIVGSAFMIFAGLLAGRKQVPHWRLGSAQFWLRGHLWLGTLSLPFILYHSGFGLGGRLEQVLWFFFAMVIGSGFFGLIMQHLLPKLLMVQIPRETFLSQLPYVKQRTRLMCDKLVSQDCGKIPLPVGDSMSPQITLLGKHAMEVKQAPKGQQKELKEKWQERLQAHFKLLFVELAKYAKAEKWIAREDDFTQQMIEIYRIPGVNDDDESEDEASVSLKMIAEVRATLTGKAATPTEGSSTASRKMSALEQMKLKKAAREAEESTGAAAGLNEPAPADEAALDLPSDLDIEPPPEKAAPAKKLSPLEQMKAQAAAKKAASPDAVTSDAPPAEKKLSPLELMKQQAAAKKAALSAEAPAEGAVPLKQVEPAPAAAAASGESEKKLSPLELMKQQAAAKKAAAEAAVSAPAGDAAPAAPVEAKKLSPLELMKQQAAAKKAAAEGSATPAGEAVAASTEAAPAKPMSPLEMMKAKAAASKAASGDAPAATAPATPTAEKPKSPLELMKAKAAAGGAPAAKPAAPVVAAPVIVSKQVINSPILRTDELKEFYVEMLRPYLNGDGRMGRFANPNDSKREFARMRDILPVELHDSLAALEVRCDEHRQFAQMERIHHWLHYWLILHIPFSIALLVLFVVHVIVALRVIPW